MSLSEFVLLIHLDHFLLIDFQELCFKIGKSSSIRQHIDDRENRQLGYRIQFCDRKESSINWEDSVIFEHYKGKVFCFSVSTGVMVTRLNGKIAIQGNTLSIQVYIAKLTLEDIIETTYETLETKVMQRIADEYNKNHPTYKLSVPKIKWSAITMEDLDAKVIRLTKAAQAGLLPYSLDVENAIREGEGLDPRKEEPDILPKKEAKIDGNGKRGKTD